MHDILSPESDADMLYHERVGPELTCQVWNLADEDIDGDFPIIPEQYPSVNVNPAQGYKTVLTASLGGSYWFCACGLPSVLFQIMPWKSFSNF